jgi:peroxiredoxin
MNSLNIKGNRMWFVFTLLLLSFLLAGCSSDSTDLEERAEQEDRKKGFLHIGDLAPDFSLELLDGSTFILSEQKGNVVLINVWASWCIPCREEAPALQAAYLTYQKKGVAFIGVAVQDSEKKIRKFVDEFGITFPIAFDRKSEVVDVYNLYGIPKTFILDREGRLSFISIGAVSERILTKEIEKVL